MDYGVEGVRPRVGPKKVRKDVVENDCQTLQDDDAMDRSNWRKLIKDTGQWP